MNHAFIIPRVESRKPPLMPELWMRVSVHFLEVPGDIRQIFFIGPRRKFLNGPNDLPAISSATLTIHDPVQIGVSERIIHRYFLPPTDVP